MKIIGKQQDMFGTPRGPHKVLFIFVYTRVFCLGFWCFVLQLLGDHSLKEKTLIFQKKMVPCMFDFGRLKMLPSAVRNVL